MAWSALRIPLVGALSSGASLTGEAGAGDVAGAGTTYGAERSLLPWGWSEQMLPLQSETGTISATLDDMTSSMSGSEMVGTISATLGDMISSMSGSEQAGTISATFGAMTAALSGAHGVAGTIAPALGDMTSSMTGLEQAGPISATLQDMACDLEGHTGGVTATISATFADMAGQALGLGNRAPPYSFGGTPTSGPVGGTGTQQAGGGQSGAYTQ